MNPKIIPDAYTEYDDGRIGAVAARLANVEAKIGAISWRTSVFPLNSGGYILPVKAEIRKRAGLGAGDEVSVRLALL